MAEDPSEVRKETFHNVLHYRIEWRVDNVYMSEKLLETCIDGPHFRRLLPEFPWLLKLGQSTTNPELKGITLIIQRMDPSVAVNFHVVVRKNADSDLLRETYRETFGDGRTWESPVLVTNEEFSEGPLKDPEQFWEIEVTLMWHDIESLEITEDLFYPNTENECIRRKKVGIDLKEFIKNRRFSDIYIRNGNEEIPAHKAILATRSSYLSKKIQLKQEDTSGVQGRKIVDDMIPSSDPDVINMIIKYMYTGNIESTTENDPFPIGINKCAETMELCHLRWLTLPYLFKGKSSVKLETVVYEKTVKPFEIFEYIREKCNNVSKPFNIYGEPFGDPHKDMFRLLITVIPDCKDKPARIDVFLRFDETKIGGSIFTAVDFLVKCNKGKILAGRRITEKLERNYSLGFQKFLTFEDSFKENNRDLTDLCFVCNIKYSRDQWDTIVEELPQEYSFESMSWAKDAVKDYRFSKTYYGWTNMTNDLAELYLNEKFSDCAILVGDERLHAHRIILAARSPYFSTKFNTNEIVKSTNEIYIKQDIEISTEVMKTILYEIYTGRARYNHSSADDSYTAAKFFGLLDYAKEYSDYAKEYSDYIELCKKEARREEEK